MSGNNNNSTTGSTGSNPYTWQSTGNSLLDSILAPKPESADAHVEEARRDAAQVSRGDLRTLDVGEADSSLTTSMPGRRGRDLLLVRALRVPRQRRRRSDVDVLSDAVAHVAVVSKTY